MGTQCPKHETIKQSPYWYRKLLVTGYTQFDTFRLLSALHTDDIDHWEKFIFSEIFRKDQKPKKNWEISPQILFEFSYKTLYIYIQNKGTFLIYAMDKK